LKKNIKLFQKKKKKIIAYHESGHAIVSWFLKNCDPLLKISVIPRGKSLGYAQYIPIERHIRTQEQLMDFICQALGGRAAEFVVFGITSTGAKDDLEKVTKIAYSAVSRFGMTSSLGPVSFPPPASDRSSMQKPYGESLATKIDEEAKKIVSVAFEKAKSILLEKKRIIRKSFKLFNTK